MAVNEIEISTESAMFATIALSLIYTLILSPISLYYAYTLWSLNCRNVPFITKRHPRVVILSVLLFNTYTVIIRPIHDLTTLYHIELGLFGILLSNLPQIGMLIISIRIWLLYYDYNHELQTLSLKWKKQITKQNDKMLWTTKYKWMGNVKILFVISGIFGSILLSITMIFYAVFGPKSLNYTFMIPSCYVIFILIMIFKVRSCRDEFCIQKEFKFVVLWMLIMIVIYSSFIAPFFGVTSNIRLLAMNIWICSASYMFSMVPTYWVITQFYKQIIASNSAFNKSDDSSNNEKKLNLEEILSTKDGFDVFANHLIREFSIENLFFVFEIMQTKNELITKNLVNDEDVGFMVSIDLGRMDKIRRVNSNVNDITDLRKTVRYIMDQYIYSESECSVNISSFTRLSILDTYNGLEGGGKLVVEMEIIDIESDESTTAKDKEIDFMDINKNDIELIKKYIVIFDKAMEEIINLLKTDSLQRFYITKEYKTMLQGTP